jgi:hypothetical protein
MRMLIAQRCLTQVQGVVKDQREKCKVAEGVEAERYLDEGKKYVELGLRVGKLLAKMGISPITLKHSIDAVEELKREW